MADVADTDTLTLTERRTRLGIAETTQYGATLTEAEVGVDVADAIPYGATLAEVGIVSSPVQLAADTATLTEAASVSSQSDVITASDDFTCAEGDNQTRQSDATVADITLSETAALAVVFGASDSATLDEDEDVSTGAGAVFKIASDALTLAEAVTITIQAAVTDTGTLAEGTLTVALEGLSDTVSLSEVIDGFACAVVDAFTLTESVTEGGPPYTYKTVRDTFTCSEGALSIRLAATDTLTLVDASGFDVHYTGQAVGRVTITYRMAGTPTVY